MTETPTEVDGEGVWTRLRRRKVVQWGLVYVAAAWGFLQGLEYLSGTYDWPRQIQQLTTLALLIGLPVVLVLAWYHGDRGQQRISTTEFAILTLLLLLGGGAFWYYQRTSDAAQDAAVTAKAAQPPASPAVSDARPSIAVLPFENRSDEKKDAYFVDGIHDDILTQLSKVSALKVISRTSVERFRKTDLSIREIAQQLGVRSILEGGVQRAGDRVRINVQLIDASTDAHVWAETYDRELIAANIFAIQSELAAAIAGALKTTLTPAEKARTQVVPTQNLAAWEAYQIGTQRMENRTTAGLVAAESHFRKAIELDPQFALAWAGLAGTLAMQTFYSGRPKEAGLGDAERAVARALELDPDLAEAWARAGDIAGDRLQLARAEQLLRRAIALNPNYASAHHWLSNTLSGLGRRDEALVTAEHAIALDPLSPIINNRLGETRMDVGRFEDALLSFRRLIDIDPTMPHSWFNIADVYAYAFGRLDAAIPWYEKAASLDPGSPDLFASVAEAFWELGDHANGERWLAKTLAIGRGTYTDAVAVGLNVTGGNMRAAQGFAHTAVEQNPSFLFLLRDDDIRRGDYAGARARYAEAFPQLFEDTPPTFTEPDAFAAVDLALVLIHLGEDRQARSLLDRSEAYLRTIPRLGPRGYGISDVAIHALRGERTLALAALSEAQRAGWRRYWRYYRDFDPNLASIRNEPEFKAVFADIERDMAKQRAALAARPKDAPLDLATTGK